MLKNDLNLKNPLRLAGYSNEDIMPEGSFGAVLARAGIGKTAFLVQIALSAMLQEKNVLHISLNEPVRKVNLWYRELFENIVREYEVENVEHLSNIILPHRFIMTFNVDEFTMPRLEERLNDLTEQNIFQPNIMIIDGLPFDDSTRKILSELKNLASRKSLRCWITIRTHRHEGTDQNGMPVPLSQLADLIDVALELRPEDNLIHIKNLKGNVPDQLDLIMEPTSMLVKENK